MAKFFIDRPIFAWVIALFIIVMGSVAITQLPISQYPPVAPPAIVINTAYPGASAQTLEDSVLSVIEREMNGSPGLIYMRYRNGIASGLDLLDAQRSLFTSQLATAQTRQSLLQNQVTLYKTLGGGWATH